MKKLVLSYPLTFLVESITFAGATILINEWQCEYGNWYPIGTESTRSSICTVRTEGHPKCSMNALMNLLPGNCTLVVR